MNEIIDTLLTRNGTYADTAHQPRPPMPTMNTIVVSCLDARADPAHYLGLASGEALVIRNSGGRVTESVEQEIGTVLALAGAIVGQPVTPHIVLVHHTRCGMARLADPQLAQGVSQASGVPLGQIQHSAIQDPERSLRTDLERLRASPFIPAGVTVTGLLYDEPSGRARAIYRDVRLA